MITSRISLAGCDCALVEWNPEGRVTVFALHGWLDNLASFESLSRNMPEVRLIAVDFPGHGHSAHLPENLTYHFIDGLYLLDDLARHYRLESINILGHSMGGAISTLYAAGAAERVNKLVLIDSLGPLTIEPERSVELIRKSISQRRILNQKRKPIYSDFETALQARAEVSLIKKSLIQPVVERGLSRVEQGYTWRADSRLRTIAPVRMSEEQLNATLLQITADVLLVEGSEGFLINNKVFQQRKQNFNKLESVVLEGGHHVHLEQVLACSKLIQDFFL